MKRAVLIALPFALSACSTLDLDPAERVAELARMMGGDEGETARAHAQQLFDDAQTAVADARAEGTAR